MESNGPWCLEGGGNHCRNTKAGFRVLEPTSEPIYLNMEFSRSAYQAPTEKVNPRNSTSSRSKFNHSVVWNTIVGAPKKRGSVSAEKEDVGSFSSPVPTLSSQES